MHRVLLTSLKNRAPASVVTILKTMDPLANLEIIDNFLPPEEFERISEVFTGQDFPWFVNKAKVMHVARMFDPELQAAEIYNWQMVNYLYGNGQPLSQMYEYVLPIINLLKPRALIRIKANLNPIRIVYKSMHSILIVVSMVVKSLKEQRLLSFILIVIMVIPSSIMEGLTLLPTVW